ncbi:hypothetical protein HYH02_008927 [Chlamydomonas schloesseri]|uniref:Uncharacterized protein n=1 Tax=Chlamydomonas schloesseri TaxID=2026947 RepID=A0A836B261_9CHLO|nr:hypothetical protein HYH02_008927 [Chlamydomonas schloesseri]|eukprot:KAG2445059.1 hypothetical protein HYH02_008927 [Chlamydomonas schloesseri]
MTGPTDGAPVQGFFDEFNKDPAKLALTEEVNRKLCEVLTELAEDIVLGLAESSAGGEAGAGGAPPAQDAGAAAAAEREGAAAAAEEAEGPSSNVNGVDEVAALAAYNDAMAAIMRESNMSSKDMCALPDDHPLKELFFSAFDAAMFHDLLTRFIGQVQGRKGGHEWDAEAAVGEADGEDHTLE